MSAVNKFLILFLLVLSSCTQKNENTHVIQNAQYGTHAVHNTQYSYMGPVERSINLKLSLNKASISYLKASFSVPYNYNSKLQYKWKLGPNVTLHQGSLTGSIDSLKKDESVDVVIAVKNFNSDENRFVRFEIFGTDPMKRIFSDGIVSSHQESSFESIVQEVEKNNAEK